MLWGLVAQSSQTSASDWNMWDLVLAQILNISCNLMLPQKLGNHFQSNTCSWYFEPREKPYGFSVGRSGHDMVTYPHNHALWLSIITVKCLHPYIFSIVPTYMLILMGSRQIDILITPQAVITSLQNHPFTCNWHWELTIVGNLSELVENIQAGDGWVCG